MFSCLANSSQTACCPSTGSQGPRAGKCSLELAIDAHCVLKQAGTKNSTTSSSSTINAQFGLINS